MTVQLKVLTLNCWGLPAPIAKLREERIAAIGNELSKGEFDVVLLEEIWRQKDYGKLCDKLLQVLPYTHYFHSGMFGSGVCIFSKHPILETFYHPFGLNGYAHRIQHGDWFGGKAVGLAKLLCGSLVVNVYVTHIHADYCDRDSLYRIHRVAQAYELGQFIRFTSEGCDAVVVGGDFNYRPTELGYNMILSNGNLYDAWFRKEENDDDEVGSTSCHPENTFTKPAGLSSYPHGHRIDYLLFRNNSGCTMTCLRCWTTMGRVPGEEFSYSDHEGVAAEFALKKDSQAVGKAVSSEEIEEHFPKALPVLDDGMKKVSLDRMFYLASMFLASIILILTAGLNLPYGLDLLVTVFRTVLTIAIGALFWMGVVLSWQELNRLLATKKDIQNLIRKHSLLKSQ